jgi:high-affinity Fe2+/Pb2+ permease
VLSALLPAAASACSVCGGGNPANRLAFFLSTIALSLIPLGMFAGGLWWLRSRLGAQLADEFQDRDAAVAPAHPAASPAPHRLH